MVSGGGCVKKRTLAGLLSLSLLLSGCSALLEREYSDVTTHSTNLTAEGDPSVLRAESYQELVNALIFFINQGTEAGSIRLYIDSEAVEAALEAACLEVIQEDPLGAYAVEHIKYDLSSVVTYYEADVQIAYRRSREQVASIVSATGATAIRSELEDALTRFAPEQVLRISYFSGDEDYIRALCHKAYYAVPAAALDLPDITVAIYPQSGRQRIVEVLLSYHLDKQELARRQDLLSLEAGELALSLAGEQGGQLIWDIVGAVLDAGGYIPSGGSTAYHALLEGGANSQGLALATALLCQELELECQVVPGELDGQPHFWAIVSTENGWRHLDPVQAAGDDAALRSDREMEEAGYVWDRDSFPSCGPSENAAAAVAAP